MVSRQTRLHLVSKFLKPIKMKVSNGQRSLLAPFYSPISEFQIFIYQDSYIYRTASAMYSDRSPGAGRVRNALSYIRTCVSSYIKICNSEVGLVLCMQGCKLIFRKSDQYLFLWKIALQMRIIMWFHIYNTKHCATRPPHPRSQYSKCVSPQGRGIYLSSAPQGLGGAHWAKMGLEFLFWWASQNAFFMILSYSWLFLAIF